MALRMSAPRLLSRCLSRVTATVQTPLQICLRHTIEKITICSLRPHTGNFHTATPCRDLMEFFDTKENWGEPAVKVGRPWKQDELRLKSNTDLHKLWYVLLKERNMLMTMEEEYKAQCEVFPNPERIWKVEESMENILEVVRERNRAYSMLETGETGEPKKRWTDNELGVGGWRTEREYYMPLHMNTYFKRKTALSGQWQNKYLRLWREKQFNRRYAWEKSQEKKKKALQEVFPNAEIE